MHRLDISSAKASNVPILIVEFEAMDKQHITLVLVFVGIFGNAAQGIEAFSHPCVSDSVLSEKSDRLSTLSGHIGYDGNAIFTLKIHRGQVEPSKLSSLIEAKETEVLNTYYDSFSEGIARGKLRPVLDVFLINTESVGRIYCLRSIFLDMSTPHSKPITYYYYVWHLGNSQYDCEVTLLGVDLLDGECYARERLDDMVTNLASSSLEK